ncbi:ParB/RepB/Spo0J family partition protein [Raoultella terrigena]|uniref:ParB/RepB/Spo0J family partition protein n=1 Tax=Raoultella terrigena TaxID=577 RepID=UPI0038914F5E
MAKNSIDVYGASGKTNVLSFNPEALHLVDDPSHLLYDERIHLPLKESTVLNIMKLGVIEPIAVWKDSETGKVYVVFGRQRVKHVIEANRRLVEMGKEPLLIPGVVKRGTLIQMAQLMVSENEIRQADTPIGRAKKMAALQDRGHGDDDVALLFGCSVQTVQATLALLECTQAVQAAVESGEITVTHARQLADLPPEDQREKVKELTDAGAGAKGHERARRQRAVLGDTKPRLRSRKEITHALHTSSGDYADALRWVLGEERNNG